ncbi:MAG: zinc ABC transporter substrate-binding protein [Pseudomonadota bacterium]
MLRSVILGLCISLLLPMAAAANSPKVAVDIAPVHSLVAQVMAGVGKPDLIIPPGASPHEYTLRPSEAEALSRADVVFWVGEQLTPWLESPIENLASNATKVTLLEVPGVILHDFREGATFEAHDHHGDEDGHDDEHGHDEHGHKDEHDDEHAHEDHGHDEHGHDEHGHKDEHDDEHAHEDHGHDEHHHGEHDPHAWLDPENAKIWVKNIASVLAEEDAANAATYRSNATKAIASLDAQIASIRAETKKLHDIKFIVFHDAYQYFERRFDIQATGAISIADATDPSPKRVKEIRDTVTKLGIHCVFSEPQYNPQMVRTVFENTEVTTIGVMDPLGVDIEVGQDHYPKMLQALVSSITQCQN